MPVNPELLALGTREHVKKKGAITLLFHRLNAVVMRSIHEDRLKEEAVFAPSMEKQQNGKDAEVLRFYAQGMLADVWTSPGGAMEPGERPEQTVLRELGEEVLMSVQDHRPKDIRLAESILSARLNPIVISEMPIPVVVQTNKKDETSPAELRGVFEVLATRIDLTDDQFYPLCGAGIFRYLTDVHITERIRPTLKYLLKTNRTIESQRGDSTKRGSHV